MDLEVHINNQSIKSLMIYLSGLNHPNIVALKAVCFSPRPALVSEFASGGSLRELIKDTSISIDWPEKMSIVADVARGVYFMHSAYPPVLHGDLKAANVLVRPLSQTPLTITSCLT